MSAFSMHYNYAISAEEDCPKKQSKRRNYGVFSPIGSTCGALSVRWLASVNRTNHRIRSLRYTTFRLWNKIGEGNRQIRSVTLEKGLALRAFVESVLGDSLCDSVA